MIAVLSDIHANKQALETVLEWIGRRGLRRLVCLGDVVGYGAHPRECLAAVSARAEIAVRGNHDQAAADDDDLPYFNEAAREAMLATRRRLSASERERLGSLPMTAEWEGALLFHANLDPARPWKYITGLGDVWDAFERMRAPVGFFGHTHLPVVYRERGGSLRPEPGPRFRLEPGDRLLINPGSVGQPRDGDPRASFAVYDPATGSGENVRLTYPVSAARAAILDAGLPSWLAERLGEGR
ncbi:MAG TPA: metallophosphoesterase family protein [bacterium]|nr:metallophosphoesterase family protein [bacterium]